MLANFASVVTSVLVATIVMVGCYEEEWDDSSSLKTLDTLAAGSGELTCDDNQKVKYAKTFAWLETEWGQNSPMVKMVKSSKKTIRSGVLLKLLNEDPKRRNVTYGKGVGNYYYKMGLTLGLIPMVYNWEDFGLALATQYFREYLEDIAKGYDKTSEELLKNALNTHFKGDVNSLTKTDIKKLKDALVFAEGFESVMCSQNERDYFSKNANPHATTLLTEYMSTLEKVSGANKLLVLAGVSEDSIPITSVDRQVVLDAIAATKAVVDSNRTKTKKPKGLSLAQGSGGKTGKPLVIWSNGMGGPAFVYEHIRAYLGDNGYNVVMGDDAIGTSDFVGTGMVAAWEKAGKPSTVGFVGHSKGGAASINAARTLSDIKNRSVVSLMGAQLLGGQDSNVPFMGITATEGHWGAIEDNEGKYNAANNEAAHFRMKTSHSAVTAYCMFLPSKGCNEVKKLTLAWFDCTLKNKNCGYITSYQCDSNLFEHCKNKQITGSGGSDSIPEPKDGLLSSLSDILGEGEGNDIVSSIVKGFMSGGGDSSTSGTSGSGTSDSGTSGSGTSGSGTSGSGTSGSGDSAEEE